MPKKKDRQQRSGWRGMEVLRILAQHLGRVLEAFQEQYETLPDSRPRMKRALLLARLNSKHHDGENHHASIVSAASVSKDLETPTSRSQSDESMVPAPSSSH